MSASVSSAPPATVRVPAGTTAADALREAGAELSRSGRVRWWSATPPAPCAIWTGAPTPTTTSSRSRPQSPDGLAVLRHSTAHVLAQAVQDLFPGTSLGIGPPITDGFYYDFLPERPFTPDDLAAIEKRMQQIVKAGQRFARRPDHRRRGAHRTGPRAVQARTDRAQGRGRRGRRRVGRGRLSAGGLTMYDNLDAKSGERVWTDLCRGPHLPTTRRIPAFTLIRSAAAYWRGDEKNPQLQRIYGTAWASRDDLKAHLYRLEEAAKRDHRKLGTELDLFSFPDEIGSGLPVFHPKGGVIKREMEDYVRQRHIEEGFLYVGTPHISKEGLFHTSGHLPYYADGMFPPMDTDAGQVYLKAMNCPMHNLIYRSRGRSYRELPLRLFEFGHVYRYEKSGVVHGLTRVRGFEMDDSHSYVMPEQARRRDQAPARLLPQPVPRLRPVRLLPRAVDPRRLEEGQVHRLRRGVGRRDRGAGARGRRVRPRAGARPGRRRVLRAEDLGAGPRRHRPHLADVDDPVRLQPAPRLRAGVPGRRRHAAAAGDDPLGQVRLDRAVHRRADRALRRRVPGLAVAGAGRRHSRSPTSRCPTCTTSRRGCSARGLRVEVDESDDRMQKKIRTAQKQKVPFMVIAGATDAEANAVSFRYRDGSQRNGIPVERAIDEIVDVVARRVNESPSGRAVRWLTSRRRRAGRRVRRRARRLRPAVDAAPDGLHPRRGQAEPRRRRRRVPVLPGADALRRGRPDRRARGTGLRGAEPLPVHVRAPDGGAVPARRGLRRAGRRGDGRVRPARRSRRSSRCASR